jgi:hypothetical protein
MDKKLKKKKKKKKMLNHKTGSPFLNARPDSFFNFELEFVILTCYG